MVNVVEGRIPVVVLRRRGTLEDSRLGDDLYPLGSCTCSRIGQKDLENTSLFLLGRLQAIRRKRCPRLTSSWL